jgi:hypothetical protein
VWTWGSRARLASGFAFGPGGRTHERGGRRRTALGDILMAYSWSEFHLGVGGGSESCWMGEFPRVESVESLVADGVPVRRQRPISHFIHPMSGRSHRGRGHLLPAGQCRRPTLADLDYEGKGRCSINRRIIRAETSFARK